MITSARLTIQLSVVIMPKKTNKPPSKRTRELNILIRTAALTFDPQGGLNALAERAGVHPETIRVAIRRGRISAGLASALELAAGKKALPKEKLCPQKFKK